MNRIFRSEVSGYATTPSTTERQTNVVESDPLALGRACGQDVIIVTGC